MLEFEGRTAVASSTGQRALIGAWENSVATIDLRRGNAISRFETRFDAGGHRLALSDQVDGVLAAAFERHGLALYSCITGTERWRRADLKKIQRISLSRDGLTAFCGREAASLAVIDINTGETKRQIRGAQALYESSFDRVQVLDTAHPHAIGEDGNRLFTIDRVTFAFLDVGFAPGAIVVSESGGPVRCIDNLTGAERWRYTPKNGSHVLELGFRLGDASVLGVEWPFEKGGPKTLVSWALSDGKVRNRQILGQPEGCCFGLEGSVVVFSDGSILPTQ